MRRLAFVILSLASALLPAHLLSGDEATPKKELRIVSISPSTTEIVFKLGRGKLLVGRDSSSNYPAEALALPVVGSFGDANLEKLIALKPAIVLTSDLKNPTLKESLAGLGMTCVVLKIESIADYQNALKDLGKLLSCEEAAAKETARVNESMSAVAAKLKGIPEEKRPSVYFEIWDSPLMTAGKRSFINECIALAGGRNIAADTDKDYFSCSPELIISSAPDVIICPSMAKSQVVDNFARRSGWEKIPALVNKRIYPELNPDILFRPGPRMTEAVELLYKCINKQSE